ncbi:hypothetical protein FSOLCH5_15493 [Fusarium solani]
MTHPPALSELQRPSGHSSDVPIDSTPPPPYDDAYAGLDWGRIPGYIRPNNTSDRRGWYWEHGFEVQKGTDEKNRFWLCKSCHQKKPHKSYLFASRGVENIKNHMLKYHHLDKDGEPVVKRPRHAFFEPVGLNANNPRDQRIMNHYNSAFEPDQWKKRLLRWVVRDQIPFHKLESEHFRDLCQYANPLTASNHCLPHHTTIRAWIIEEYASNKGIITELLHTAQTKIHVAFDLWTSRSMKCFAGLVVHFIDANNTFRTFLLDLPEQSTGHTGIGIAERVKAVLAEFAITEDQIGYFVADNATENDTCLEDLSADFNFDKAWRRLRCMGHVINLVARALLFGKDPDGFAEDTEEIADDLLRKMKQWRKAGPVGKLHNIMVWLRSSSERLKQLHAHQRAVYITASDPDAERKLTYDPVLANDTRWNSNKAEIERGLLLRKPIDIMIGAEVQAWQQYWNKITHNSTREPPARRREKPHIVDDALDDDDWHTLTIYLEVLKPFEEATTRMQGNPGTASGSRVWDILPTYEFLLQHLEEFKTRYKDHKEQHFRYNINQAWMKLDKYYGLTDDSPIYVAAVVLHPRMKWSFVDKFWNDRLDWRDKARRDVRQLWEAEYKHRVILIQPERPPERRRIVVASGLNDFLDNLTCPAAQLEEDRDEYDHYLARTDDPEDLACTDPITYWISKRSMWPHLSQMALDILSIPCMSDEPERIFSFTGLLTPAHRARLGGDIIGASLCLADWDRRGVIDLLK